MTVPIALKVDEIKANRSAHRPAIGLEDLVTGRTALWLRYAGLTADVKQLPSNTGLVVQAG